MATHALPSSHILDDDAAVYVPPRPSLLRRFYDALLQSRMRHAHREIDRVLGPGAMRRAMRGEYPPQL